jgi:hypothetical protein
MKTQLPIPVVVVESITNYIEINYSTISENHKAKLFSKLVELWFTIYVKHENEKSEKESDFNSSALDNIYANINKSQLSKFTIYIGNQLQYTHLIKILEDSKLINVNNSYEVGKNPKSYRPNPEIKYDLIQTVNIDLSKFLENHKTKEQLINENPTWATKLINDLYLVKVDLQGFYKSIDQLVNKVYKLEKGKEKILTESLAYGLKIKAIKIDLGIHFFSIAPTGRIYSSIANLPKLTLPFISLKGQIPVEIDAANCQPLLLASLIDNEQFKLDCESGTFYDKMALFLNISRTEFKLLSYSKIFFNNKKIYGKMAKTLDLVYPGLSEQINQFKAKSNKEAESIKKENPNALLWHRLQSLEASIFISTAKEQLTPVITRHDSILCWSSEVESIRETLKEKFNSLGIKVTFK